MQLDATKAKALRWRPDGVCAALLLVVVAIAPLPFGSADSAVMALWCIVLGIAAILAPVRGLRAQHLALVGAAAVVVVAYGVVLHEQLASEAWFSLSRPDPMWHAAADALGVPLDPSVSIARNEPFFAIGSPLVCVLSLTCGFTSGVDRDRARRLLWVVAWSGFAYAIYGILAHLIDPTRILWREKPAYVANVTSTFVNRNTAAVYFGSCAVVCLALMGDRVRRFLPRGPLAWRKLLNLLLMNPPREIGILFVMLFVCLAAMFMTASRAGVLLSLVALVVTFTVYFHRDLPRRTGILTAALGASAVALVLLGFMGAGVSARFDLQGAADGGRLSTYRATLRMIADHPWLGTGQGTFTWLYPAYRTSDNSMWGIWDRAHNTLLEIAADMGLPLAILVGAGWMLIFGVLIHGVRVRQRDLMVPVAALSIAILAVLHSLVDFSLQIPGYAIPAFALVGAGLAQSFASARAPARPELANSHSNLHMSQVHAVSLAQHTGAASHLR